MKRTAVDSSNVHSVGHDETGLEVQFHRTGCSRMSKPPKGETIHAGCNCVGGDVYHYPGVPAEIHAAVIGSASVASALHKFVKAPKHPETGTPLYPHVKRDV